MSEKKNYDSAFCGNLPLHQINLLQPYGALIVLNTAHRVIQVSENLEQVIGIAPADILNRPFNSLVEPSQYDFLKASISKKLNRMPAKFTFSASGKKFFTTAIIHTKDEQILLELEQTMPADSDQAADFVNVYHDLKVSMTAIEQAETIEQVCEVSAAEIKKISGFDKVMIYQFDKEWNGKVVAEMMEPGMESYLGLVFPASDIPRQARALYNNNPYRLIPDRNYKAVKLYPLINPLTHGFLDLSDLNLRGVASVHLEYMKNMGITASMSTRIMRQDKTLWGLISCHHLTAKPMTVAFCTVFELLSTIISAKINSIENTEAFRSLSALQQTASTLVKQVFAENDLFRGFFDLDINVMQLFRADGVSLQFDDKIQCMGKTPPRAEIEELVLWLSSMQLGKVYAEENLSSVFDRAINFSEAGSGILAIPLRPGSREYLILYREQVIRKVKWGGNPEEAIQFEKNSLNYHPRNSFHIWQETVANTSLPWKSYEVSMAEQLRSFILDYLIQKKRA